MNNDFPHLKVTKNDLARPTKQFIMQYYATMLEQITRMPVRDMCCLSEEQIGLLSSDVSMTEHATAHNLYMAVKYMFDKIELFNQAFHYSDILFPSLAPKRSFVFMGTLYLFYTTCAEFDEVYEKMNTVDAKKNTQVKLNQQIAKLKEQIRINQEKKITFTEREKDIKKELSDLAAKYDQEQLAIKSLQAEEEAHLEKLNVLEEQERKMQELVSKINNEKKYYESLIVSDDSQILENQAKLSKKKEECLSKLQQLEAQVKEGSSKISQFDAVLKLYDDLNHVLRGEIAIENKSFDLKGLSNSAAALKKEGQILDQEVEELQSLLQEKDEALPCSQNGLARLDAEKDSITCTWKEKQGRYQTMLSDLQRSVSELTHRALIEQAGFKDNAKKITQLSDEVVAKREDIQNMEAVNQEAFLRFEAALIQLFRHVINQALLYRN